MGVSAARDRQVAAWRWRAPENAFLLLPVAFILTTVPGVRPHEGYNLALDGILNNLGYAAAPAVCFLRWRRAESYRTSWLLLTIGSGALRLGQRLLDVVHPADGGTAVSVGRRCALPFLLSLCVRRAGAVDP